MLPQTHPIGRAMNVVRTTSDPEAMAASVRREMRDRSTADHRRTMGAR